MTNKPPVTQTLVAQTLVAQWPAAVAAVSQPRAVQPTKSWDATMADRVADFCRLAGKMLDPADFIFDADGDVELIDAVFAGARTFAE